MDRLALHIEYLLLKHDCVVVPGFGAFINVRHSALSDATSGMIQPVCNEIRFNSALRHDDGMLATSYSRRERVSFAEGREMVRAAVSGLRDAMALDGHVSVGRVGNILCDDEGNLSFHPRVDAMQSAAELGFLPVASRVLPHVGYMAGEHTAATKKNGRKFDTDRNYYIPVNKMFARMAASFALVAVFALAVFLPFNRDLHEDQASVIPVQAITKAVAGARRPVVPATQTTQTADSLPAPAQSVKPHEWHLIVATFRTAQDADNYIASNTGTGYNLTKVSSKRLVRVSARGAAQKEDLLDELNSSAFRETFPQAWIYRDETVE